MRVVERNMLRLIRDKVSGNASKNTRVVHVDNAVAGAPGWSQVWLFDKHIADVMEGGIVEVNESTLRAWPTVTTRSRLRALGVNVWQEGGEQYLDGVKL